MEQKSKRGGARPNSGRPKRDSNTWGQITCILRKETIAQLRAGCGGAQKHFGPFLQDHLDRHPLPDRETYEFRKKIKELHSKPRTAAVVQEIRQREKEMMAQRRAQRKKEKYEKWAKAHPKEAATVRLIMKGIAKVDKEQAKAAKAQAKAAKTQAAAAA